MIMLTHINTISAAEPAIADGALTRHSGRPAVDAGRARRLIAPTIARTRRPESAWGTGSRSGVQTFGEAEGAVADLDNDRVIRGRVDPVGV